MLDVAGIPDAPRPGSRSPYLLQHPPFEEDSCLSPRPRRSYRKHEMMFHAVGPGLAIDEPEPMTKLFVKDLEVGIA